jgi:hypothetical protein
MGADPLVPAVPTVRRALSLVLDVTRVALCAWPESTATLAYHVDTGQGYAEGETGGHGQPGQPVGRPGGRSGWGPQGGHPCWVHLAVASPRLCVVLGSLLLAEAVLEDCAWWLWPRPVQCAAVVGERPFSNAPRRRTHQRALQEGRCDTTLQKGCYPSLMALGLCGTGPVVPPCRVPPTVEPTHEGKRAGAQSSGQWVPCLLQP